MYFASWSELWSMAGHGFYVWLAYGIAYAVLLALVIYPLQKKKQALKAIKQRALHDKDGKHAHAPQA